MLVQSISKKTYADQTVNAPWRHKDILKSGVPSEVVWKVAVIDVGFEKDSGFLRASNQEEQR